MYDRFFGLKQNARSEATGKTFEYITFRTVDCTDKDSNDTSKQEGVL